MIVHRVAIGLWVLGFVYNFWSSVIETILSGRFVWPFETIHSNAMAGGLTLLMILAVWIIGEDN